MIEGHAAAGFEPVRAAFAANFENGMETGAGLAVARDGAALVDLWGGHADAAGTRPWRRDTLVNVWSVTKAVAALAVAILVDRRQLGYAWTVARVWPEFAAAGKADVTVGQLMSHQAGLCGLRRPSRLEDFFDWDRVVHELAAQAPVWPPGAGCGYHPKTFGHLAGELVRRVTGKPIAVFVREEMTGPLSADIHIGLAESEEGRVAAIEPPPAEPGAVAPAHPEPAWFASNPALDAASPNRRDWRAAVIPGANGHATALALATLYDAFAGGRSDKRVRPLTDATLAAFTAVRIEAEDLVLKMPSRYAAGVFLNDAGYYGPGLRTFGHGGWGGSFVVVDPDRNITMAYVMNRMLDSEGAARRSRRLYDALYACL